jgi:hypothetical protein
MIFYVVKHIFSIEDVFRLSVFHSSAKIKWFWKISENDKLMSNKYFLITKLMVYVYTKAQLIINFIFMVL